MSKYGAWIEAFFGLRNNAELIDEANNSFLKEVIQITNIIFTISTMAFLWNCGRKKKAGRKKYGKKGKQAVRKMKPAMAMQQMPAMVMQQIPATAVQQMPVMPMQQMQAMPMQGIPVPIAKVKDTQASRNFKQELLWDQGLENDGESDKQLKQYYLPESEVYGKKGQEHYRSYGDESDSELRRKYQKRRIWRENPDIQPSSVPKYSIPSKGRRKAALFQGKDITDSLQQSSLRRRIVASKINSVGESKESVQLQETMKENANEKNDLMDDLERVKQKARERMARKRMTRLSAYDNLDLDHDEHRGRKQSVPKKNLDDDSSDVIGPGALKPKKFKHGEKEIRIAKGIRVGRKDYATMDDVSSDWEDDRSRSDSLKKHRRKERLKENKALGEESDMDGNHIFKRLKNRKEEMVPAEELQKLKMLGEQCEFSKKHSAEIDIKEQKRKHMVSLDEIQIPMQNLAVKAEKDEDTQSENLSPKKVLEKSHKELSEKKQNRQAKPKNATLKRKMDQTNYDTVNTLKQAKPVAESKKDLIKRSEDKAKEEELDASNKGQDNDGDEMEDIQKNAHADKTQM